MPYIYQADLWCESCGERICRRLNTRGEAPATPDDETSYDSDDYPKPVMECCGDYPDHCAAGKECIEALELPSGRKIGALLSHELTTEGWQYVAEAQKRGGEVAELWADTFGHRSEDRRGTAPETIAEPKRWSRTRRQG